MTMKGSGIIGRRQWDLVLPVYAAGNADGVWDLAEIDRLPSELAETIRRLAR
jgi:hypothetical protein